MSESLRMRKYQPLMNSLYSAARGQLGFEPHVKIVIIKNDKNLENPLGKTAHYSPSEHKIALYTQGRHIKDILRSLAHELVHHNQNCRGDFNNGASTVVGYAQEDGHLREMEREAYECGNMIFRDWEDNLKKKGARPLFTSTHYTPPMATSIVGGRLVEGEKMKNKVNESRLREIIQGVIQEMFNDDLSTGDDRGLPQPGLEESKEDLEENKEEVDESKKDLEENKEELEESKEELEENKEELEESKEDLEENKEELEESKEELEEDKEELEESKEELEEESDVTEEVNESFFPKKRSIREKARNELNEALMERWKKIIK